MNKYNVGDKVKYLDVAKVETKGIIAEVLHTDIYDWNKEEKPLYFISNYPYVRTEEEILELC